MKLTDARLASMIARDPVEVSYTVGETAVLTTGLLHRGGTQSKGKSDDEQGAGEVERQQLRLLVRAIDVAAAVPVEGTKITVAGKVYRGDAPELSSDQNSYTIALLDENG